MESINKDISVGLIINQKDQLLLQKKDRGYFFWPNYWCLFGGGIKNNETSLKALVREMKNENGLSLSDIKLFCIKEYSDVAKIGKEKGLKRYGKLNCFTARFLGDLKEIKVKEGIGFAFFDYDEIKKYNKLGLIIPYLYEVIDEFYKSLDGGTFNFKNE